MKLRGRQHLREVARPAPVTTAFLLLGCLLVGGAVTGVAQTEGTVDLETTLRDYNGSGSRHWTVAWVTTASGAFIKTLWIQGNRSSFWSSHWDKHCRAWYAARNGSQALDGYTSATATSYTGVNSPILPSWDCRDANGNLVPDGQYRFWVQYAEDSGQGPYTTNGLLWTKGPAADEWTYPDQGANFTGMKVVWSPVLSPEPPEITAARIKDGDLILAGVGPASHTFHVITSDDLLLPLSQWTAVATNQINAAGEFSVTNKVEGVSGARLYRLRLPWP